MKKNIEKIRSLLEETGALKFGEFELSSGKKSNYYIDIKKASTSPVFLKLVGKEILRKAGDVDKLAGVALGGIPLVVAASMYSQKPYLMIRKKKKEYGTTERVEGALSPKDQILMVEDVTTTGNSLLDAVETIREVGGEVKKAVVVVDREEGAKKLLKNHEVDLNPLLRASDLINKKEET